MLGKRSDVEVIWLSSNRQISQILEIRVVCGLQKFLYPIGASTLLKYNTVHLSRNRTGPGGCNRLQYQHAKTNFQSLALSKFYVWRTEGPNCRRRIIILEQRRGPFSEEDIEDRASRVETWEGDSSFANVTTKFSAKTGYLSYYIKQNGTSVKVKLVDLLFINNKNDWGRLRFLVFLGAARAVLAAEFAYGYQQPTGVFDGAHIVSQTPNEAANRSKLQVFFTNHNPISSTAPKSVPTARRTLAIIPNFARSHAVSL